jgi:uncharacterized coiled-coil protein SlyX
MRNSLPLPREEEVLIERNPQGGDRLFPMATLFHLDFHGTRFTLPKLSLFDLFEHHRGLFDATSYEVQSSVPLGVFELFMKALETGGKVPITKENAGSISLLAKEFWLDDLLSECSTLQMTSTPELITALSERISKLERQMTSQPLAIVAELKESIANHERQLESLDSRIFALEPNPPKAQADLKELKSVSPTPFFTTALSPPGSSSPKEAAFRLGGIISYLTRKHGGNVHDKGIITITSKSVWADDPQYAPRNLADFTSDLYFNSRDEPGQWICWDFHQLRVRPTRYTITSGHLQSWVVASSLDGKAWTEIDRKKNNEDLRERPWTASFAVSKSAECRFIRLTRGAHFGHNRLVLEAFEVFGTLLE